MDTGNARADMERHAHETLNHRRLVVETTHMRKDGVHLPVEVVATTIADADGKPVWFVANVQDISERKRLQQSRMRTIELEAENRRIEEANRLKSEFLANMSHELRTPLNAIIGFAELLHDEQVGVLDPKQKEFLGEIVGGGLHLLRLINDVLDLAKVEAGKMDFRPEPVDLARLVGAVVQNLRATALGKHLQVETSVDATLEDIVLDPGRFTQLLYNYVSNALKFTPDGGYVTVRAKPEGADRFCLEVEDSGPGIPVKDEQNLFTPFQQLDSGTAKRYGGTGLGLALSKQLAEAQGGTVGVRPAPNHGSIFFAVLPRRPAGRPHERRSAPVAHNSRPVLVVDDDGGSLRLMDATLAKLGYDTLCFSNATDALQALQHVNPIAVVIDLLMPNLDGIAFLERFRTAPSNRQIPVIVWTVKDLSEDERRIVLATAHAIVRKGVGDGSPLSATMQAFLPPRDSVVGRQP